MHYFTRRIFQGGRLNQTKWSLGMIWYDHIMFTRCDNAAQCNEVVHDTFWLCANYYILGPSLG